AAHQSVQGQTATDHPEQLQGITARMALLHIMLLAHRTSSYASTRYAKPVSGAGIDCGHQCKAISQLKPNSAYGEADSYRLFRKVPGGLANRSLHRIIWRFVTLQSPPCASQISPMSPCSPPWSRPADSVLRRSDVAS